MSRALRSVETGQGCRILVEGQCGIGKSRLLEQLHDMAERRHHAVIKTTGRLIGPCPIEGYGDTAGLRELPAAHPDEFHALLTWAASLLDSQPVMLIIDDAHHIGTGQLHRLADFSRHHATKPLALALGYPPVSTPYQPAALDEALGSGQRTHIHLLGLADDVMIELITEIFGMPPGSQLLEQVSDMGGNPLFVIELLRCLQAEHQLTVKNGRLDLSRAGTPSRLGPQVLRPVDGLSRLATHMLRVASVLGERFRVTHLAAMTGQPTAALLPAIDEAMRAGVLTEDETCLVFPNRFLHRAVYGAIPEAVRSSLHLDAARLGCASSSAETCRHLAAGTQSGDRSSIDMLAEAAREAMGREPEVAATLLRRAVSLTPLNDRRRTALVTDLIAATLWAGRIREAEQLGREAHADHPFPAADTAIRLGRYLRGRPSRPARVRRRAARPENDPTGTARAMACTAWEMLLAGDLTGAERTARAMRQTDDALSSKAALSVEGMVAVARGRPDTAVGLAETQLTLQDDHAADLWPSHLFLAMALRAADRFSDAEGAARTGLHRAEKLGAAVLEGFYEIETAELNAVLGDRAGTVEAATRTLGCSGRAGTPVVEARARLLLADVALHDNDLASCRTELAHVRQAVPDDGVWPIRVPRSRIAATLAEAEGDPGRARDLLLPTWSAAVEYGWLAHLVDLSPDLVRLCRAAGEPSRAMDVTRELSRAVGGSSVAARPVTRAATARCRAMATGRPDLARKAAEAARPLTRPWLRAATIEEAGTMLERSHAEDSVPLLEEALEAYRGLGAVREIARVQSALRRHGVRGRRQPSPPDQPPGTVTVLTPAERRVLELLSDGMSNRTIASQLYISHRTVETHISHMFAKLGVASRTALVAAARTGGGPEPTGRERE